MEFDFTPMNRILKNVLKGVEFEPVINRLQDCCLSEDNHQVLMTIAIESDLLAQKLNFV